MNYFFLQENLIKLSNNFNFFLQIKLLLNKAKKCIFGSWKISHFSRFLLKHELAAN